MSQAIVIATTPSRYDFLKNCMDTLEGYDKYPIIILSDYTYGEGKIDRIINHTDIEEFTLIADSMEILDPTMFDILFQTYQGQSVSYYKVPQTMYMGLGKYKSAVLRKLPIDWNIKTFDKSDAVSQTIGGFYLKEDPDMAYLLPDTAEWETGTFIEKFGRKNMVVKNDYFIKYKGHWSAETLPYRHVTRT